MNALDMTDPVTLILVFTGGAAAGALVMWWGAKIRLMKVRHETEQKMTEQRLLLQTQQEQIEQQKAAVREIQQQAARQFEHLATKLLSEKADRLTQTNRTQLNDILRPLKEKIAEFRAEIDRKAQHEAQARQSLFAEVISLKQLNQQISQEANNLARALKGDNKLQGNWGELQLQRILENAGLQKEVHFRPQFTGMDEDGQTQRPDFIVHLPEEKHIIIDSKVSLKDFEKYIAAEDPTVREAYLRAHIKSLRQHIKKLSSKKYQNLKDLNTPDFVFMFVPIEPAFHLAVREAPDLLEEALRQNVVLVTTTTLLATLRTVAFLWRQDKQNRSVREIARLSGQLYDKFAAFVEDMNKVGKRLRGAEEAWQAAMNKLSEGKRPGDTILGKAEKIKALGARTTKSIAVAAAEED